MKEPEGKERKEKILLVEKTGGEIEDWRRGGKDK